MRGGGACNPVCFCACVRCVAVVHISRSVYNTAKTTHRRMSINTMWSMCETVESGLRRTGAEDEINPPHFSVVA